jgi:hypothetical protein
LAVPKRKAFGYFQNLVQMKTILFSVFITIIAFLSCQSNTVKKPVKKGDFSLGSPLKPQSYDPELANNTDFDSTYQTIHIFVALCDNKYQGIVPVPKAIGNGQDPNNNLYWGCGYGIRTYFKKSKEWKFLRSQKIDSTLMERIVFKHVSKKFYLVADAYNGKEIEKCTREFFQSTAGIIKDTIQLSDRTIGIHGNSSLCAYIGHYGLMDFRIDETYASADGKVRDAIILACVSKKYYAYHMEQAKARPLVWTTNFMAPEAYTIHDALTGYVLGETSEQIRSRAAAAYSRFQNCSVKAARGLLVSGF